MVHPSQTRSHRSAGFTLLEALVVVAIIGITAALAAPALSEAMADRRAGEAMHGLVRIGARARSEAMATGRAHVLVYTDASSGTPANGMVQLWRGRSNLCTANAWGTIISGACSADVDCLEALDMGTYNHGTHQVRLRLPGTGSGTLCFQPDGEVLVSRVVAGTATRFSTTAPDASIEGVTFTINRLVSGSAVGVQRRVVFPFGGSPRVAL
ncbi:MAG: prepilin-type N-terminal cleavage/methylation domain-containing protein [Sandaracinaceae bacterium]|nr:prepilin-type N-terminal cleavage/methylation domain-containing protein [Sandaracinaceae bacterium]